MARKISIVTPVYNDFEALEHLLDEIQTEISKLNTDIDWSVVVIDDASVEDIDLDENFIIKCSFNLYCIKMIMNGGHQIAISNGLRFARSKIDPDFVIVMDGDGEDDVREIGVLLEKLDEHMIIACSRLSRTEGIFFRFSYSVFKLLFKLLTGHNLNFGNFCAFNKRVLHALTQSPMTDITLAGTLLYMRLPIYYHWTAKRKRYCGTSKMGALRLIEFAIGHMKVFSKKIILKIFIATLLFVSIGVLISFFIFVIKFSTDAPSGWASLALLMIFVAGVQALLLGLFSVLGFGAEGRMSDRSSAYVELPMKRR